MRVELKNFGHFETCTENWDVTASPFFYYPNGYGKTTLINAYYFAVTGRTLKGFEARRIGAPSDELTAVTITGDGGSLRRTLDADGKTSLYINGDAATQTQLEKVCDVGFLAACADVNILASQELTADELRKLLTVTDVIETGETSQLRDELRRLNASKRQAEQSAVTTVVVPPETCEPPTIAELDFLETYQTRCRKAQHEPHETCEFCGAPLDAARVAREKSEFEFCVHWTMEKGGEYARIIEKRNAYDEEQKRIAAARQMVETAKRARDAVRTYEAKIADVTAKLYEADCNALRVSLPAGVELVTTQTLKNGTTRSVCTLTIDGVPLKSVNRAKRVTTCVRILSRARIKKGLEYAPIIVDNAESVQGLEAYNNLIAFCVGWLA